MNEQYMCVMCGEAITLDIEYVDYSEANLPPCCCGCIDEVKAEVAKDYSMWPSDWKGGYYRVDLLDNPDGKCYSHKTEKPVY